MAVHFHAPAAQQRGQPQNMQGFTLPAPVGGVNDRIVLSSNDTRWCVYAFNLVPSEYGMRTRPGFREWAVGVPGTGVRTLVPFLSSSGGVSDRLFAVSNLGIYDVTTFNMMPTQVQAFATTTGRAGFASYAHFTDDNGGQRILFTDEANGYFIYTAATDSWAQGAVTGVDPATLAHVATHKQRVWFAQRDSTDAWYLDLGALEGPATRFGFGAKFRYGGDIVGNYTWTRDSGAGIDDRLVTVSRGGDVLVFEGADPSSAATWNNIGTFYVGEVPTGRRTVSEYGGELRILSDRGLTSVSDLLRGTLNQPEESTVNDNIARFLREDVAELAGSDRWEIVSYPSEGTILLNIPQRVNGAHVQYALNTNIDGGGWGFWRDVPALTFASWQKTMMFGAADGRVLRMDVAVDNLPLSGAGGTDVSFSMLPMFLDGGAPARVKYGEFIRPNFLSTQPVSLSTRFLYDYDLGGVLPAPQASGLGGVAEWDVSLWDQATWGSGIAGSQAVLRGGWNCGRTVAAALRGEARARATLVSTEIMWRTGGNFGPFT